MALSKKLSTAVKDAQKQAEAAAADLRGQLERRIPEMGMDPTPFYAVVGAANIAVDTVKAAGEQLEAARAAAKKVDLRKGAKKETKQLQKELQRRIEELQTRTAELQTIATKFAESFVAQAQELPAQVLNQGLVLASNAKDQFDAAAARGEQVVTEARAKGRVAAAEGARVAQLASDTVADDVKQLGEELEKAAETVDNAIDNATDEAADAFGGPAEAERPAARKAATRKTAAKSTASKSAPAKKAAPKKTAAKKTAAKKAADTEK